LDAIYKALGWFRTALMRSNRKDEPAGFFWNR
jgi:hypothetical protein